MKKIIAFILMLAMVLSLCACGSNKTSQTTETAQPEKPEVVKIGVLTMLSTSEKEMADYYKAVILATRTIGDSGKLEDSIQPAAEKPAEEPEIEIVFYDSLDAMLMALNAGDIGIMSVYNATADYLVANNDDLVKPISYDYDPEGSDFNSMMLGGLLSNSFSFMMMKGREDLRDEFNKAITSMQEDDTLGKLIKDQMRDVVDGKEVKVIEMPVIEGAETIRVAVTGSLPPMDYVAADGTPAGYNTAVLAEIGKRIGKNIELVVVDSVGRAAALASGTVDAVFWTRTSDLSNTLSSIPAEERKVVSEKFNAEEVSKMTEQEQKAFAQIEESFDIGEYGKKDMPEGTIITVSYFRDSIVPVTTKAFAEKTAK